MKKTVFTFLTLMVSMTTFASTSIPTHFPLLMTKEIPAKFASSSETGTMEWGCPVAEVVSARSGAEALHQIGQACMEQAKVEASKKPGVFDVIKVSVIWPDIRVSEAEGGYLLKGTMFLETLVLKGGK